MRWIDEHFHQPADLGGPVCPRRSPRSSPTWPRGQRLRDGGGRQRRRRLGLRLMLDPRPSRSHGHRPASTTSAGPRGGRVSTASSTPTTRRSSPPGARRSWDSARDAAGQPPPDHRLPRAQPEIDDEQVEGPLLIIGLPRTGTTALSHLVAADPQIRSLRLWESSDPVPPPEAGPDDDRPAHRRGAAGPRGHVRGLPPHALAPLPERDRPHRVPGPPRHGLPHRALRRHGPGPELRRGSSTATCPRLRLHRRVLQLLQWHCPPRLWHLKTPVHMLASTSSCRLPGRQVPWTHRDPAGCWARCAA